jgi:hypothetical protein
MSLSGSAMGAGYPGCPPGSPDAFSVERREAPQAPPAAISMSNSRRSAGAGSHISSVLNPEAKADVQHSGERKLATLAKRRSLGLIGPHTLAIYEAGIDAERDGYSAVCIDTISESGMKTVCAPGSAQSVSLVYCQRPAVTQKRRSR